MKIVILLLPLLLALLPGCDGTVNVGGQYGNFMSFGAGAGDAAMERNDDGSLFVPFALGTFRFLDVTYSSIYLNNNGDFTFSSAYSTFTPSGLQASAFPMIAPYWADVDTRAIVASIPNTVWYQEHVDTNYLSQITTRLLSTPYADFMPNWAFAVTWDQVGFYPSKTNALCSFQCILAKNGTRSMVIFNYGRIDWTTGGASGGDANGLGGSPAHAGFSDGTGQAGHWVELPLSGTQGVLTFPSTTNVQKPGMWVFLVGETIPVISVCTCDPSSCKTSGTCQSGACIQSNLDDHTLCSLASGPAWCIAGQCVANPCAGVTCEHGTCVSGQCVCDSYWVGTHCSTPHRACHSWNNETNNWDDIQVCAHGDCLETADGSFQGCACVPGWGGTYCSLDIEPPSLTCPSNVYKGVSYGTTSVDVVFISPIGTDAQTQVVTTCVSGCGPTYAIGTTLVIFVATDQGGNTAQCSFTVTVKIQFACNPGFEPPLAPGTIAVARGSRTLPIKMTLYTYNGNEFDPTMAQRVLPSQTSPVPLLRVSMTTQSVAGLTPTEILDSSIVANQGDSFTFNGNQKKWIINKSLDPLAKGLYVVSAYFSDPNYVIENCVGFFNRG